MVLYIYFVCNIFSVIVLFRCKTPHPSMGTCIKYQCQVFFFYLDFFFNLNFYFFLIPKAFYIGV